VTAMMAASGVVRRDGTPDGIAIGVR